MTADDFRAALRQLFRAAEKAGRDTVVVRSGDLHRGVGGYPGSNHRMPVCCEVMYGEMIDGVDEILRAPPRGKGASLEIEYLLPRPEGG
ncbi:MAG: HNH endonuclease [Chloroflexi bacterium]|nr:HNH endonuclease [Chloroflexota bacterium]